MKEQPYQPIIIGDPLPAIELPSSARISDQSKSIVIPETDPKQVLKDFEKVAPSMVVPDNFPDILDPAAGSVQIASFSVGAKTGTAVFLDMFDVDHFDGFTDMAKNVSESRAWFSANGYTQWGSTETKTGRINCYFHAPETRTYRCDATLQSFEFPATVECVLDDSSFGTLNVNGVITQPHSRNLAAGYHHFRIRQVSGSFFFLKLTVYAV